MKQEVTLNDLDIDQMFFYLENKVRDNVESNIEAELYEEILMTGRINRKYYKVIRKLKKEMEMQ